MVKRVSRSIIVGILFVLLANLSFDFLRIASASQDLTASPDPVVRKSIYLGKVTDPFASAVLYNQPPGPSGSLLQSSRWDPDGSDNNQYVWEAFTLPSTQSLTEIKWRGGFDPTKFGSGGPVVDFVVAIYASIPAGTQPDVVNPPLVEYQTGGNAGQTPSGSVGNIPLYDYHFALPKPFQAAAGTKYWLYIEALQHGQPDWGLAPGTGGDGSHFRKIAGMGDYLYQTVPGDGAFSLLGPSAETNRISLPFALNKH